MIKKVHYMQLALLILLLFVLFQITSISISFDDFRSSFGFGNRRSTESSNMDSYNVSKGRETILLITGDNDEVSDNIEQELIYLKRGYKEERSLVNLSDNELKDVEMVIIASKKLQGIYDLNVYAIHSPI